LKALRRSFVEGIWAQCWFRLCRDLDDFVVVTAEHSLDLGVMHGGEFFHGAKGISFNLGDFVMAADSNGTAAVLRQADQAAEGARVVLVGTTLALGELLMTALRSVLDRTLPPWLKDVSKIALDEQADGTAWARGAAAAALKELYGAPWSTTRPARPRNPSTEAEREAE
jgi:hypothetical protein